jgi:hypothetical protein
MNCCEERVLPSQEAASAIGSLCTKYGEEMTALLLQVDMQTLGYVQRRLPIARSSLNKAHAALSLIGHELRQMS